MPKIFHALIAVAALFLIDPGALRAQDEDGGAVLVIGNPSSGGTSLQGTETLSGGSGGGETISYGGGTLSLGSFSSADALSLFPTSLFDSPWTIGQGDIMTFDLKLYGGGVADVHSFSIDLSSVPYLTLATITTELPAGYSYTYNNGVFTGTNLTGTDISSAQVTIDGDVDDTVTELAALTFTLDPNAPLGSTLALPQIGIDSALTDSSNNTISLDRISVTGGPIVVAPEPTSFRMILTGVGLLALLGGVRGRRPLFR